jgi:hypothetical protein
MDSDRNSKIRHACGGVILIATIMLYPTYVLIQKVF